MHLNTPKVYATIKVQIKMLMIDLKLPTMSVPCHYRSHPSLAGSVLPKARGARPQQQQGKRDTPAAAAAGAAGAGAGGGGGDGGGGVAPGFTIGGGQCRWCDNWAHV